MRRRLHEKFDLLYCSDSLKQIKTALDDIRKNYLGTNDMRKFDQFEVECDDDEMIRSIQQDLMAAKGFIDKAEELLESCSLDVALFLDEL